MFPPTEPPPPVPEPPHNRTPTSREAAKAAVAGAGDQRAVVLAALRKLGTATRDELQEATGLPQQSVGPRVWELLGNAGHAKLVEEVPGHTRPTRFGRAAVVLRIVEGR
jgi:hypothetical protein